MLLISQDTIFICFFAQWIGKWYSDKYSIRNLPEYLSRFISSLVKEILVLLVSTLLVYFHVSFNCFLVSKLQIGLQYFHKVYIHCCCSSWMWFLKHVDPSKISRKQWFLNLACIIITWKATCWGSVPRVPGLLGLV